MSAVSKAVSVPGAHRDADLCRGQRRRVVDPVADHRHIAVFGLQRSDRLDLLFGQQLGAVLVDPGLLGDRPRGPLVVAGQHHDALHAQFPKALDRPLRVASNLVGDGNGSR